MNMIPLTAIWFVPNTVVILNVKNTLMNNTSIEDACMKEKGGRGWIKKRRS